MKPLWTLGAMLLAAIPDRAIEAFRTMGAERMAPYAGRRRKEATQAISCQRDTGKKEAVHAAAPPAAGLTASIGLRDLPPMECAGIEPVFALDPSGKHHGLDEARTSMDEVWHVPWTDSGHGRGGSRHIPRHQDHTTVPLELIARTGLDTPPAHARM